LVYSIKFQALNSGLSYIAMGSIYSVDESIPPGGALLYVQRMEFLAQPCFSEAKPHCLSHVPDGMWHAFSSKVAGAASQMWSEKAGWAFCLAGIPFVFSGQALRFADVDIQIWLPLHLIFLVIFMSLMIGPRLVFASRNGKQDRLIELACQEFANATGASVQYRRQFTGFCRPKGAVPYRAIAIAPYSVPVGTAATPMSLMTGQEQRGSHDTAVQMQSPTVPLLQAVVPPSGSSAQSRPMSVPLVVTGRVVSVMPGQ